MADPIKTTVQEAFDHINQWIAEGSKDKAIQGLNEILGFDPENADAKRILQELQAPATPPAPPNPSSQPLPTPAQIETPLTPAPTPQPAPPPPAPAPIVPAPMPPPSEPLPTPPPLAPPVTSEPTPPPKAVLMQEVEVQTQGLSKNIKLMILIGGVVLALIGGFFFYRVFLSPTAQVSQDIQNQVESAPPQTTPSETTSSTEAVVPINEETASASASESTDESSTEVANSASIEATGEKVKRR